MLTIITIVAFVLVISAILGCATYAIMGTWIAALIAGIASLIIICVCSVIAFIICKITKKKSNDKLKQSK